MPVITWSHLSAQSVLDTFETYLNKKQQKKNNLTFTPGNIEMEDPVSQLASYRLQLGQVEAALTGDPENAELLALKVDLDEIIGITSELVEETNNKVKF